MGRGYKCTTIWHTLFVRGELFSVKIIGRSRNSCQVISRAYHFQVPATQVQVSQKSIKLCISFEIIKMKEGFLEPLTEFPLRVSVTTVRLD